LTGVHEETRAVNGPWSFTVAHKKSTPRGRAVRVAGNAFLGSTVSVAQKMFCGRSRPRGAGYSWCEVK
jgi:hypothetical protein